ncbi:MAG: hypothetical protein ACE5HS_13365 [bacterium]
MSDTTPEIREMLVKRFRAMSAEEKMKKTSNMFATAKKFAEIAVKRKNPSLTGVDLKMAIFRWIYQKELSTAELDRIEKRMREFCQSHLK